MEYEGKINTLMAALEEKAIHSVDLARQAKKDEVTIKELTRTKIDLGVEKNKT